MTGREGRGATGDPTPSRAAEVVREALDAGALVTVAGECTVDGDEGESTGRLAVCKPDGTVLVHGREGASPIARRGPGPAPEVDAEDGLRIGRAGGAMTVRFDRIERVDALGAGNDDPGPATEETLRERVLDEPDLVEPGFRPLATERPTPAGAVDVFGEDVEGNAVVIELKRRRAGPDAVGQLDRYVDALERDLHAGASVRGFLVAPSLTGRARDLLEERGLEFVALRPEGPSPG